MTESRQQNGLVKALLEMIRVGIVAIITGLAGTVAYLFELLLDCYRKS